MQNLLNPKWIYIINTLPVLVLFFLLAGEYNVIKTLLSSNGIQLWSVFAFYLTLIAIGNFGYACLLLIKKKQLSVFYAVINLILHIIYLYLYACYSNELIPFGIPDWMLSGNILLYAGTFLMPSIAFSMLILIIRLTPENKNHNALASFLIALALPVVFFLFFQVILPLWRVFDSKYSVHVIIIFIITGTVLFLFYLVRCIYILALKKEKIFTRYKLAWKIPITIILPLLGLVINNGHFINGLVYTGKGMFGNLGSMWFYVLAAINGLLLCLPSLPGKKYRIALYIGRCITFSYTFYFFIVFLPFLPLSVIAVLAAGAGILLLVPLLLFIVHIKEITADFIFLNQYISKGKIRFLTAISIAVIPLCITLTYINKKAVLNNALSYIYQPDYSKEYNIKTDPLLETLKEVKKHKNSSRDFGFFSESSVPYLSAYFKWIVLDNMTLSDSKINHIEKIFKGSGIIPLPVQEQRIQDSVFISAIHPVSIYNKKDESWQSTIELELTNGEQFMAEYKTAFNLPDGCWINDYYLYINNKKEKGILAEKKAAMWVFSEIQNKNRDPGILYYTGGNDVAFKVFPFSKGETRKTGISFIHKEPVKIVLDGLTVQLGDTIQVQQSRKAIPDKDVIYISVAQKQNLKKIQRSPYYHFVIDVSENGNKNNEVYINRIEQLINTTKTGKHKSRFTFTNTYIHTIAPDKNWKHAWNEQTRTGGFYAERAIEKILYNSYMHTKQGYPVIVLVTDSLQNAVLDKNFSDLKFTFPDNDIFYHLTADGLLEAHSLIQNPGAVIKDFNAALSSKNVLQWSQQGKDVTFLRDDNNPEVIIKNKNTFVTADTIIARNKWESGLYMYGQHMRGSLHPDKASDSWLTLLRHSFATGIMSPLTSYLVVENEAQKAALKRKQDEILSGNKSLDAGEDIQRMSEPGLFIMLVLLGIIFFIRNRSLTPFKLRKR